MLSIKKCAFFAWILRLPDYTVIHVFVSLIVTLYGSYTVGPLRVYFMSASTLMSSVFQEVLDVQLSYVLVIVLYWGASTIEL